MPGFFAKQVRQFSILVLGSTLALSACAPKDEKLAGGRGGGNNNNDTVAPSALDARKPELARHLLLQLAEARRFMDVALNLKLKERALLPPGKTDDTFSACRSLRKVAPAVQRTTPAFTEIFEISHGATKSDGKDTKDCVDQSEADNIGEAKKRGSEKFFVSYGTPLPQEGDAEMMPSLPTSLIVESKGLVLEFSGKKDNRDKLRLDLTLNFSAVRDSENETTVTYTAQYEVREQIDSNIFTARRLGNSRREIQDLVIVVDKATRQVTSMKPGKMALFVDAQEFDKINLEGKVSPGGQSLGKPRNITIRMEITAEGEVKVPQNGCSAIEGTFVVTKPEDKKGKKSENTQTTDSMKLTVSADKSTVDGDAKIRDMKICDDKDAPIIAAELGSIYY